MVMPKYPMGCQFLNTHHVAISDILACNTNVSTGDPNHTYYSTLYCSKSTQAEDKELYQRIALQIGRRIEQHKVMAELDDEDTNTEPSFLEGLCRVLSGIQATITKDVVSSTMSHLMVCQDGKRFTFSHDFDNILLTQISDVLEGKECSFSLRNNRNASGEFTQWPDSFANDYLFRSEKLEAMCLYEMVMKFQKCFKTFKQMNKRKNTQATATCNMTESEAAECNESDISSDDEEISYSDGMENDQDSVRGLSFTDDHPGAPYSYLKRRKNIVIPKISAPPGKFCYLKSLDLSCNKPSETTCFFREDYAKYALMLFLPFRDLHDLKDVDGSYWTKFISAKKNGGMFWRKGLDILQNMQTRLNAEKMKRVDDALSQNTVCAETEALSTKKENVQHENDISSLHCTWMHLTMKKNS